MSSWLLSCICALVVVLRSPVQFPMPHYFEEIRIWAATGHIDDTFTPIGYPLSAGPAYRSMGIGGVVALQGLLYLAIVLLATRLLRRLGVPPFWSALGTFAVIFHPEILLSITKLWDVNLSVFLLLLSVLLLLQLESSGPNIGTSLALGAALGAGIFCRPNYALLALVLFFVLARYRSRVPNVLTSLGAVSVTAAAIFATLGILGHGSPFAPRNGPYNFFAGNNPYSAHALLHQLNAEPSIPPALAAEHALPSPDPSRMDFYYAPSLEGFYRRQAVHYIQENPAAELRLVAIKFFTLFRPDTKVHRLRSIQGLGKAALTLPALLVAAMLLIVPRGRLDRRDGLLLVAYLAYVLPFLLTNSDPRFRIPLDILLLLHLVRLLHLRFGAQQAKTAQTLGSRLSVI